MTALYAQLTLDGVSFNPDMIISGAYVNESPEYFLRLKILHPYINVVLNTTEGWEILNSLVDICD